MKHKNHHSETLRPKSAAPSVAVRLYLAMAVLTWGLYAVSSLGLGLLYSQCSADVLLASTPLPLFLDTAIAIIQSLLIPAAAWTLLCFAFFVRESPAVIRNLFLLYLGSLLFCRLSDLGSVLLSEHSLDLVTDVLYAAWYFLLDAVFALVLFFGLVRRRAQLQYRREAATLKASLLSRRENSVKLEETPLYPFRKPYEAGNPLLACSLRLGIVFSAVQVVQRVIYDIVYSIENGLPALSEIPVMLLYYTFDLLTGVLIYALMLLGYRFLFHAVQKKKGGVSVNDTPPSDQESNC